MRNEVPELVLEIIFIYVVCDATLRNRQLAILARVCKDWSTPALNLLWRRCNDLSALLETLPVKLLTVNQDDGSLVSCLQGVGIN